MPIFNFFLNALSLKSFNQDSVKVNKTKAVPNDKNELLSLSKLNQIVQIFNKCSIMTGRSTNNSNNFKESISLPGFVVSS